MADRETVSVTKEMAVTHADFFRTLPSAFPARDYQVAGTTVRRLDGDRELEIKVGPEGVRQIALLKLPQTPVTLTFTGYTEAERETLIEQFDKGFQRAGG